MGKGSGGCDERAAIVVGEGESYSALPNDEISYEGMFAFKSELYHLCLDEADRIMMRIAKERGTPIYSARKGVKNYVKQQLYRYGKGKPNSVPSQSQINDADEETLQAISVMITDTVRAYPAYLRAQADALESDLS